MISIKEGNRRLLILADFLDTLPPERFDFNRFVGDDYEGDPDLWSCGTTACALGWATTLAFFRELGLKLERTNRYGTTVVLRTGLVEILNPYQAAAAFFATDHEEATRLFCPFDQDLRELYPDDVDDRLPCEATPTDVAAHIRKFVAERGGG